MDRLLHPLRGVALASICLVSFCLAGAPANALVIGQVDDFEDGTMANWIVGLLGNTHPAPRAVIADGGPAGAGDAYLRLTAIGGSGAGNRLSVINLARWAGDYTTIDRISLDARNQGASDLTLRLFFENPRGAPPADTVLTAVTALRIVHSPAAEFPPVPVVAQLGVDNIRAVADDAIAAGASPPLALLVAALTSLRALRPRRGGDGVPAPRTA